MIRFGDPDRTALIWGMQFMRAQLEKRGTNRMKIAYNYYKDAERGLYAADAKRSLTSLNPMHETNEISFSLSDIDDNGLFFFKNPDNPSRFMKIVASTIFIEWKSHYFNFDFLGTFYDYDTAWDGKHSDNKDDNFNDRVIGSFWITGEITYNEIFIHNFFSLQRIHLRQLWPEFLRPKLGLCAGVDVMMTMSTCSMQSDSSLRGSSSASV